MRLRLVSPLLLAVAVAACAPGPTPSPSRSAVSTTVPPTLAPTGTAGPSPSTAGPALTWVGDPITVAEAIQHRDTHLDDTELAIAGYAWSPAGSVFCPLILPASPAMALCPDNLAWISDADPGPQTGPEFIEPAQPAIPLLIRRETYAQLALPPQPGRVITMGHFDDHRATDCPTDQVDDLPAQLHRRRDPRPGRARRSTGTAIESFRQIGPGTPARRRRPLGGRGRRRRASRRAPTGSSSRRAVPGAALVELRAEGRVRDRGSIVGRRGLARSATSREPTTGRS